MTVVSAGLLPALAAAAPWELKPNVTLPDSGYVSQKVELVDFDNDGFVDVALANSSGTDTGNQQNAQLNQLLRNNMGMDFSEVADVFTEADNAYVIKAGDLDNDGDLDLVVGVNYLGTSYVLLNEGNNAFTRTDLPGPDRSVGELELGDVDLDGDLDIFASDWGMSQPYGDPVDEGGPLVLWLGDGAGGFTDGNTNLPMGVKASYVFDLELVDIDNDFDLDVMVSSRGVGNAVVLENDGAGTFTTLAVPALQPMNLSKQVNVAFTPIDLNFDPMAPEKSFVDVLTLQDGAGGGGQCVMIEGKTVCAKRNSLLVNTDGTFADNPGTYWDIAVNAPKLDFDAATLDFDNNGTPDVVTTGVRLAGMDINSRLLLNNGTKLSAPPPPNDAAFPVVPQLAFTFGLQFADFDRDGREDVALATRDAGQPSFVLFGRTDMAEGVPVDTRGPRIAPFEKLPDLLFFGKDASGRTRAHDRKTPTHLHDYLFDDQLPNYNLTGDAAEQAKVHKRRIPYMEFALSLANPDELANLPDSDPNKYIAPSTWYGEALWRVGFTVPYNNKKVDTLTWNWCAIDAAGNKECIGPFQVNLQVDPEDCGNGIVEPWETCDEDSPLCVMCEQTCGNGTCDPNENNMNCPEDCPCDNDGACDPGENPMNCPDDCDYDGVCGDNVCQNPPENNMNCPDDCPCDNDGMCEPGEGEGWCPDCMGGTASDTVTDSGVTDSGAVCGDGVCEDPENSMNCPEDCGQCPDGICQPEEMNCPQDCMCNNDGVCDPNENKYSCPNDCDGGGDTDCDSAGGAPGQCELDDDGCGCVTEPSDTRGLWASLLLFGAFGVRRFRKRA